MLCTIGLLFGSVFSILRITPALATTTLKKTHDANQCPFSICKCDKKNGLANCSDNGKNLSRIPELPSFVNNVMLNSDYFPRLNKTVLRPLRKNNINDLSIKSSQLKWVNIGTFQELTSLESLDLGSNVKLNVTSLKHGLASLSNKDMKLLAFEYMRWKSSHLAISIFTGLVGRTLRSLRLGNNKIEALTNESLTGLEMLSNLDISSNSLRTCPSALQRLRNLTEININGNQLQECDITNFPKTLTNLILSNNQLKQVPYFCSWNNTALLPDLQRMQLDNNLIFKLRKTSFYCLPSLKYLNLKLNNIRRFPAYVFTPLHRLHKLYIVNMKQSVKYIGEGAFSIPSLIKFVFSNNGFSFRNHEYARRASLSNCTNLRHLELSYNYMPKWPDITRTLLQGLTKLETLLLINVRWRLVPDRFFQMFPNLQKVDLSSNNIPILNRTLFAETSHIRTLLLSNNRIAHVGPNLLSEAVWKSLERVDLSGNPYACDCQLLWFRDKLKTSKNITFKQYPKFYKCLSPPQMKGFNLAQFNLTEDECKTKSEITITLVSTGTFVALVLVSVMVVYKCRWHIRYWIYLLRYKRTDYTRLRDQGFMYDGFIIYSEQDNDFVHDILLDKLEKEHGFKMCVHYRDFEVGKIIVENIVSCMSESRQAVVVVSKYFCESQWCKFELLLAQDRWLRNESEALIIVMLDEIDSRHMTKDLRALIQTTTYCTWTGNDVGKELFWEQLLAAMKKEIK